MELKMGKCKGMTIEQVLAQSGGDKLLAGHLAFVEKGFSDPQWGEKNKKYYNEVRGEWARLTAKTPAIPVIQQSKNEVKMGPSDSTKLDILNKQLHDIAKELKKLDILSDKLDKLDLKIVANHEARIEVEEIVNSPDKIAWEN